MSENAISSIQVNRHKLSANNSLPYNSSDPIVFELPFHPDWQEISASDQIIEALEQMTFEASWEWFKRARWDGYFGGGL